MMSYRSGAVLQLFAAIELVMFGLVERPVGSPGSVLLCLLALLAVLVGYGLLLRRRWALVFQLLEFGGVTGALALRLLHGSREPTEILTICSGVAVIIGLCGELYRSGQRRPREE